MNYQELAEKFIKEHEGVGYQSQPQIVAVNAFAKWLEDNASQQSVQPTCSTCGAELRPGDIWWNECEKCHSIIASG